MTQIGDADPADSVSLFKRRSRRKWTDSAALLVHRRAKAGHPHIDWTEKHV